MRILVVVTLILAIHAVAFSQTAQPPTSQAPPIQTQTNPGPTGQSQTEPTAANAQTPPYVTYQLFFLHLASLNQIAAQEEAKGRNGTGWRTHEQRAAQLNEEEGRILQQVASDCNQAVKDLNEKADSVVAAFRTQHPNEESFRLPPPELVSLQDQKTIIVNSYVTDLQVKLGADAFRKLDDYIQSKFNNVSQPAPSPESRRPGGLQ